MNKLKSNILIVGLFFILSIGIYYLLDLIVDKVFCVILGRCIPFITNASIGFIGCVSIALFFSLFFLKSEGELKKIRKSNIILFFSFWLVVSIVLGGLLWAYIDMGEIGYIGQYNSFLEKGISNIKEAFYYGPIVLVLAFPYNILCLASFFYLMNKFYK